MRVLSIILGIFLIIGGFSCMFTPLATFLATGYFLSILFLVYGIMGIVAAIVRKKADPLEIVVSILAIIVGIICIIRPGASLVIDDMAIYFAAAWFIVQGVVSIWTAVRFRSINKFWVLGIIVGILSIVLGIYSIFHPMVTAIALGLLIGFYFIESGLGLITLSLLSEEEPLK